MKEVKRDIMTLIEPFMDKTPCVGAYIKKHKTRGDLNGRQIGAIDYSEHLDDYEIIIDYFTSSSTIRAKTEMKQVEELWGSYDITAVLKYIKEIRHIGLELDYYYKDMGAGKRAIRSKEAEFIIYGEARIGTFPNKPLHLYTEQEDILLLELLKKLGKQ